MHDTAKAGGVALPSVYTELGDIEPYHLLWAFLFGQVKWAVGAIHFQLTTHLKVKRWKAVEELTFKIWKRLDFQNMEAVEFGFHLFALRTFMRFLSPGSS